MKDIKININELQRYFKIVKVKPLIYRVIYYKIFIGEDISLKEALLLSKYFNLIAMLNINNKVYFKVIDVDGCSGCYYPPFNIVVNDLGQILNANRGYENNAYSEAIEPPNFNYFSTKV